MDKESSYARTLERLEEIVAQVKAKDISLEKSLDLYEEALRLGNRCAEMIDHTDFSVEELTNAEKAVFAEGPDGDADATDATDGDDADGGDATDATTDATATDSADAADIDTAADNDEPLDEAVSGDGDGSPGKAR
ncbi:MAG: exodeoxyribonuclease VII small subunit [Coriobacteriales bacterium]|jgi:exodeoxyribonuclease VII small subunit|nr:exodeoxyribonuclease VII small subunit [Coriobacteriales bacterium]